jgi:hypothetical protein
LTSDWFLFLFTQSKQTFCNSHDEYEYGFESLSHRASGALVPEVPEGQPPGFESLGA